MQSQLFAAIFFAAAAVTTTTAQQLQQESHGTHGSQPNDWLAHQRGLLATAGLIGGGLACVTAAIIKRKQGTRSMHGAAEYSLPSVMHQTNSNDQAELLLMHSVVRSEYLAALTDESTPLLRQRQGTYYNYEISV